MNTVPGSWMVSGDPLVRILDPTAPTLPGIQATLIALVQLEWTPLLPPTLAAQEKDRLLAVIEWLLARPVVRLWTSSERFMRAPERWPRGVTLDVPPVEFANGIARKWTPLLAASAWTTPARAGFYLLAGWAAGATKATLEALGWGPPQQQSVLMRTAAALLEEDPLYVVWKHNTDLSMLPRDTDLNIPLKTRLQRQVARYEAPLGPATGLRSFFIKNPALWAGVKSGVAARPGRAQQDFYVRNPDGTSRQRQ